MNGRLKVLYVDDDPGWRNGVESVLGEECDVFIADSPQEAVEIMKTGLRPDWALLDVRFANSNMSGFDLARQFRPLDPRMAITMMTAANLSDSSYDYDHEVADDVIVKTVDPDVLMDVGLAALWQRRMPYYIRLKRFKILSSILPHQTAMRFRSRTGCNDGAERIDGVMVDGKLRVALVVYHRPERRNNECYICISSTSGCMGCQNCRSRDKSFERVWTTSELVAQVLWGMQSYHARGLFEQEKRLVANFSTEGDCMFFNPNNSCEAVEIINDAMGPSGIPLRFIMTTVGHEKNLIWFLEERSHLPITFHWSVHYRPEIRKKYMPTAATQSLEVLRDVFCRFYEKTGRTTLIAWAVAMGKNNSDADVEWLAEFTRNRPFKVNVTSMGEGSLEGVPPTTDKDRHAFAEKLRARGIPVQERVNLGRGVMASCGYTPNDYPDPDLGKVCYKGES